MKKIFRALALVIAGILVIVVCIGAYIKVALPNVGPAPELQVSQTAETVSRGQYLANHVMVCMDCHSERDWSKFSAPPINSTLGKGGDIFDEKMGFPGVYYAANITPAGIGDWTDGEIFRAITTGVKKDGSPIFPVMPHKNYGMADAKDIEAVIAYLRTLPAIENEVPDPSSNFPMNFLINTIPAKANLQPMPSPSNTIAYGKYLFNISACGECHTPFEKGELVMEKTLGGGREFLLPSGLLVSSNISSDKETGIGSWTKEMFLDRFKAFRDSSMLTKQVDFLTEFNTIMPWTMYAGMKDEDLAAIYAYIIQEKGVHNKVSVFTPHPKPE